MNQIAVKGDRDGLVVTLPGEGDLSEVITLLTGHLEKAGAFFKGANVTLDVGDRELSEDDLKTVRALLEEWSVQLRFLRASSEVTRAAAIALDLELPFVVAADVIASSGRAIAEAPEESVEALLVRRTLRSGQLVRHAGAVIVLGDVNAGAEIVAGSDVVVWGALRGVVHAGAMGDDSALVCALRLSPTQLRISSHIAVAPETSKADRKRLALWKRLQQGPEMARIQQGAIVVEAWRGQPDSGSKRK